MKLLYTVLFALGITFSAGAQTPLTEAVDFTVTDLDGNEHTLSEYLDADKYVCIDFFAYWCGPCAAHAPYFTEIYNSYGCNGGDVIFMSMEYEGSWDQTHDFEVANAGDNPAPAISGAEGGGLAVHGDYSIAAYPTFILIDPEWNIVEQDIWPMNVEILDEVLQSYGLEQMTCTSSIGDVATVSLAAWPNPASDALQVEGHPGNPALRLLDLLGREVLAIRKPLHNRTVLGSEPRRPMAATCFRAQTLLQLHRDPQGHRPPLRPRGPLSSRRRSCSGYRRRFIYSGFHHVSPPPPTDPFASGSHPAPPAPSTWAACAPPFYNWLFARRHGGTFILRIEDTDRTRFVEGAEAYIEEALAWCGIAPDEGPSKPGEFGPYRQSERGDLYGPQVQALLDAGHAYRAWDTPEEIQAAGTPPNHPAPLSNTTRPPAHPCATTLR